jgi:hypothetical protein
VLLDPQQNESFRNPDPQGGQAVEASVAGGADGDEQLALMDAGLTMMHMEAMPCPAGLAGAAVALQNLVAKAGEALAGMDSGAIAGAAEASSPGKIAAAGAEQGPLEGSAYGGRSGQEENYTTESPLLRSIIIGDLKGFAVVCECHSAHTCGNIVK